MSDKIEVDRGPEHINTGPILAVDIGCWLIADGTAKLCLIERKYEPYGWALPGGHVSYGESCENAASRELLEETGLICPKLNQVRTYSDPKRDPRKHVVSVAYLGCTYNDTLRAADDAKNAKWFDVEELTVIRNQLCFDHSSIIDDMCRWIVQSNIAFSTEF